MSDGLMLLAGDPRADVFQSDLEACAAFADKEIYVLCIDETGCAFALDKGYGLISGDTRISPYIVRALAAKRLQHETWKNWFPGAMWQAPRWAWFGRANDETFTAIWFRKRDRVKIADLKGPVHEPRRAS